MFIASYCCRLTLGANLGNLQSNSSDFYFAELWHIHVIISTTTQQGVTTSYNKGLNLFQLGNVQNNV